MRAVRKVSVHFEYLEHLSHDLDVTWRPGRGDLTACPWTVTLPGTSHSAVRRLWLCLCSVWPSHSQWPSEQIKQCACPFYTSCAGFFGKASHHPGLSAPLQPRFGFPLHLAFPKAKIAVERQEICECIGHTVHKLTQRRLTAN